MKKTVLIGVTGCVAIYKACEIVRALQKAGLRVKVVMTEHATSFISPTLFRSLTREPVAVGLFDDAPGDPIHHISLAKEADVFLIAPCTANVVGKLAHGIADDLLTTTAMATTAPIVIAPAMNVHMYESAAFQDNLRVLEERGVRIIDAECGYLACGDEGKGRLADPDAICAYVCDLLAVKRDLAGTRVLVTAGPTVEPIDPVRFISNRSSGKTGYAIASAACERGADVVLVSGPVAFEAPAGIEVVNVQTAEEMLGAVEERFDACDIAVFTAAVCDMRPKELAESKLKKDSDGDKLASIALVENPDILATMGSRKDAQIVIGFAAETENLEENARLKLEKKHADMIVGNLVGDSRAFGTDDNEVMFVTAGACERLPLMGKDAIAEELLDRAAALARERISL